MFALLTTATAAVHHRCITRASVGSVQRHDRRSKNRIVEPNHAILAKNPAYRPANGKPCICRAFPIRTRSACITRASRFCPRPLPREKFLGAALGANPLMEPDHRSAARSDNQPRKAIAYELVSSSATDSIASATILDRWTFTVRAASPRTPRAASWNERRACDRRARGAPRRSSRS
jgi:hypothetical protein